MYAVLISWLGRDAETDLLKPCHGANKSHGCSHWAERQCRMPNSKASSKGSQNMRTLECLFGILWLATRQTKRGEACTYPVSIIVSISARLKDEHGMV